MDRKRTINYFAVIYFLFIAANAFWGYAINYFRELGFDSRQIGLMTACGNLISMVALPFMGMVSDKLRSPRLVLAVMVGIAIPLHLIFPVVGKVWGMAFVPMLVLCVVSTLGRQTNNSMLDSWIGEEMDRIGASFGTIRRFGSGSFVVSSLIASLLIGPVLPTWTCFLFLSVVSVPVFCLAVRKRENLPTAGGQKEKTASARELLKYVFKNYYFIMYLFMVMAFDAFLGILNLDMSYLMDYVGARRSDVGYVGMVRASTEIVVFIIIGRQKKLPPYWILLAISAALISAENLLYPVLGSLWGILAVTLLSGVAGGFFYGIGANYVFKIVDHRAASTAMAVLGVVKSLIGILGNGIGGDIIDRFGVTTLTTGVGILAGAFAVIFLVSCILGRYVWKIPYVCEKNPISSEN